MVCDCPGEGGLYGWGLDLYRLRRQILASPLRSTILYIFPTKQAKRTLSTAVQGLPETHEAILEWFEAKPPRVIIRRRN